MFRVYLDENVQEAVVWLRSSALRRAKCV